MLTICIAALDRYPFAVELRNTAHIDRILAGIYLTDRLSGQHLATIKSLRLEMPLPASEYAAAEYQQVDGMIAALDHKPETAAAALEAAASWFEDHDLLSDAAVSWLQYSWAVLGLDSEAATQAALTACAYMGRTGIKSHGLQKVAQRIYFAALQGNLSGELLRRGILRMVCPRIEEARPV